MSAPSRKHLTLGSDLELSVVANKAHDIKPGFHHHTPGMVIKYVRGVRARVGDYPKVHRH